MGAGIKVPHFFKYFAFGCPRTFQVLRHKRFNSSRRLMHAPESALAFICGSFSSSVSCAVNFSSWSRRDSTRSSQHDSLLSIAESYAEACQFRGSSPALMGVWFGLSLIASQPSLSSERTLTRWPYIDVSPRVFMPINRLSIKL